MRNFKLPHILFSAIFFLSLLSACGAPSGAETETPESANEANSPAVERDVLSGMGPNINIRIDPANQLDPQRYYFERWYPDADSSGTGLTAPDATYTIETVDRPPLYSAACEQASDPVGCSFDAVRAYLRETFRSEETVAREDGSGLVFVTFLVDASGQVGEGFEVMSDSTPCPDCPEKAVAAIKGMDPWVPARLDGEPVAVKLTVPVILP